MYAIMSDLGKYLVNRYALCLKGSNMPRPPLLPLILATRQWHYEATSWQPFVLLRTK